MNLKDAILPYGEDIRNGTSDSILASLYRTILNGLGIESPRFQVMVGKYVNRVTPLDKVNEISSIRGYLRKELLKSTMSWKVFVKGLLVLSVKRFDIALHLRMTEDEKDDVAVLHRVSFESSKSEEEDAKITKSVLSALFRESLVKLNITTSKFDDLLAKYIIKANIPVNIKEVASTRGNIKKEFMKESMSWKVFIKTLMFLNVRQFTIGVNLYHPNGKVTAHYRTITLDAFEG